MTNEEIANFIANLLLRNLPKPNNGAYISNESLPYCMLEDGALAVCNSFPFLFLFSY